jgi:hypothetical protein
VSGAGGGRDHAPCYTHGAVGTAPAQFVLIIEQGSRRRLAGRFPSSLDELLRAEHPVNDTAMTHDDPGPAVGISPDAPERRGLTGLQGRPAMAIVVQQGTGGPDGIDIVRPRSPYAMDPFARA